MTQQEGICTAWSGSPECSPVRTWSRRGLLCCCLLVACVWWPEASWGAGWLRDPDAPRKIVNVKLGLALEDLHASLNPRISTDAPRLVGQFGIQSARKPWMAEVSFETTLGFTLAGGWFHPLMSLGYGHVAMSLYPYYRVSAERAPTRSGESSREVFQTLGVGSCLEYLMYNGHLSFYLEVRQSVLEPVGTWFGAGVSVSPLLILLFR